VILALSDPFDLLLYLFSSTKLVLLSVEQVDVTSKVPATYWEERREIFP
jgi:hypothetical protein